MLKFEKKIRRQKVNKTGNPKAPPSEWKIEIVYSINKENESRKGPGKNRGLPSLQVLGKVLQSILDGKLRDWLLSQQVLPAVREHSLKVKQDRTKFSYLKKALTDI